MHRLGLCHAAVRWRNPLLVVEEEHERVAFKGARLCEGRERELVVDMHGLTGKEAEDTTESLLEHYRSAYRNTTDALRVSLVVGRGLHSERGVSVIGPVVGAVLAARQICFAHTDDGIIRFKL